MTRHLALALAMLPAVAAAQPACPARVAVTPSVEVIDPEPRVLPPVRAAALAAQTGHAAGAEFPHHLGVTTSRVEWTTEITVRGRGPQGGPGGDQVCAVPTSIRIRLSHAEHTIRLAREVPPGGCLANEVMAHERRHVEVNRQTLRVAAEELRQAARAWATRAEARAADLGAAASALQDDLSRAIEPAMERLRSARETAHAAIDTPTEYRRLSALCPADQRRLREALRRP